MTFAIYQHDKQIEKVTGEKLNLEYGFWRKIFNEIVFWFPHFGATVLAIVIFYIVYLLWK